VNAIKTTTRFLAAMRRLPILALPILTAALVACSSGAAPGWTYAPAPSATPAGSGSASGAPNASGGGSAAPSGGGSAAPSGGGSGAPSAPASPSASTPLGAGGSTLTVTAPTGAATAGFQPTELTAKAHTSLTIHFDNQDNQAPHNVELKGPGDGGPAVQLGGDTQFFQGPGTRDYTVPPLAAGTYQYFCVVHPSTMKGTLTIQ